MVYLVLLKREFTRRGGLNNVMLKAIVWLGVKSEGVLGNVMRYEHCNRGDTLDEVR